MLTTTGPVSPLRITQTHPLPASGGTTAAAVTQKYDSANFSEHSSGADTFFRNLVSRIAQEVRTTTTTADIRQLRQDVQSGRYTPNPGMIAGRMLLISEE